MPRPHSTKKPAPLHVAMETESEFQACASRLKALADPDRLRIVNTLLAKDESVSALAEQLGMPIDKVSHHLGVLRAAHLVQTRKEGKFVIYSVPPEVSTVSAPDGRPKTIDLGCCQLDLVQPTLPAKGARRGAGKKR